MTELKSVVFDLNAEGDEVDRLVADLDADDWTRPTPAPGWTVAHQIAHLTFIFRIAAMAAGRPEEFRAMTAGATKGFDAAVNAGLAQFMDEPEQMLRRWREERAAAAEAISAVPPDQLVPWLVRPIPPTVLASAGIMELFGHGQDIADALGKRREPTDRLRHLVAFAVLTRDFGYQARGLTPPEEEFRFEITAPSGELWTFGSEDATQRVCGPAVDFCLLVTRRRHRDDLAVTAVGEKADHWLDIAQAYRGPAGEGRKPGQFAQSDR